MPWKTSSVVTERTKFVLEYERRWKAGFGQVNVAELCRMFGVSRQTGYVWIRRFREAGDDVRAVVDRSRRPLSSPTAVSAEMQDFIVAMRKQKPKWGPRMLRAWLMDRHPSRTFPSASTFAAILKRNGLSARKTRRRRPRAPVLPASPLGPATTPNSVWCIDFKGDFKMGDGEKCYPLTLVDAYSRFCLRCEATLEPTFEFTWSVLDSAFREFGLPATIRSDNGAPFAGNAPAGLSKLSARLLRLGLRLERISRGKPQENGRQERFHRTLKAAAADPPEENVSMQQRAFNRFRTEYNEERPHSSLGMKPPATRYVPSLRKYPRPLLRRSGGAGAQLCEVDRVGRIRWNARRWFVSNALVGEHVEVMPAGETKWSVHFGSICLGHFDTERLSLGFVPVRRPRCAHYLEYETTAWGPPWDGLRRVRDA